MSQNLEVLGLSSDLLLWQFGSLTLFSFAVGVLGGFVGLALGTMRLPALLLLGMPAPVAAGTNIMVSSLSAATGMLGHLRHGRVNLRVVAAMGITSVVGAFFGGFSSGRVPEELLITLAGVLVAWQGVELILRARRERHASAAHDSPSPSLVSSASVYSPRGVATAAGVGLGVGLLGGAVGLILGSIRLPALIRVLHVEPRIAAGTNLFIGFLAGSFGWIGHVSRGNVDYPLLVGMGVAAMAGTFYGAKLTGRVRLSRLIHTMGWVLLVVGVLLLVEAYRRAGS